MPLTVRHLSGPTALEQCAEAFDALSAGSPVTSRRPWLQAWVDCYTDWSPWVVLVLDGDEPVAVAPLATRRRGPLLQVVGLGHGPTDDLRLPTRDEPAAEALADAVAEGLAGRGAWTLCLDQVPPEEPAVVALLARLGRTGLTPGEGMPAVRITGREPRAYLSKNTRKALSKISSKLGAAGLEPVHTWTRDPAVIRGLLPQLARIHRDRDADLGRRSDHADPRAAAFYREVIGRHADRGEVELLTVHLGGELAAYACGLVDGRSYRSWDNRLAPAWAGLSAGRIANTEVLRHVVASPDFDELDWMQGEEPYKLQSATHVVPTAVLWGWSSAAVRTGHGLVERVRAAKRSSPALTRLWWRLRPVEEQPTPAPLQSRPDLPMSAA